MLVPLLFLGGSMSRAVNSHGNRFICLALFETGSHFVAQACLDDPNFDSSGDGISSMYYQSQPSFSFPNALANFSMVPTPFMVLLTT